MRESKDLIGKPVISVSDGRLLGSVRDIYLDETVSRMSGIHLGTEGLLKRRSLLIQRENVVVFGVDAVLVKNSKVVTDSHSLSGAESWLRLETLKGREIDTPGGTKVASVGDVVLDEDAQVVAIKLARVFVTGPIAEKGVVARDAVIEVGNQDGVMTIDLVKAEGGAPEERADDLEDDPPEQKAED